MSEREPTESLKALPPPIKHIQYLSPSVKILKTGHGAHDGPWLGSGFFAGGYSTLLQVEQEMFG